MRFWGCILFVLMSTGHCAAQPAEIDAQKWISLGNQAANMRIAAFESKLNETCSTLESLAQSRDRSAKITNEALQRKIIGIKKQIWSLPRWETPILISLKIGEAGLLRSAVSSHSVPPAGLTPVEIEKMPEPARTLAKTESVEVLQTVPLVQAFQILDDKSLLAKIDGQIVFIDHFSTAGMTDKSILPDVPFVVVGTKRYEATVGSNTVMHLQKISDEKINELNRSITPEIKYPPRLRQWSDATKKFNVEAELVSLEKNTVTLVKPTGEKIQLPMNKLSADDKNYVIENLGEEKSKKR